MRTLPGICVTVFLAMININVLPSVSGQDTSTEYMTVHMLQGICWYTISNEAGYVIAEINDIFGIDKITTLTCKLTIQAPSKNQGVLLQFTSFNVTASVDCLDDTLILFDGPETSSPELTPDGGLCGDATPGSYMSSGDSLTLLFFTDQFGDGYEDNEVPSMFRATWTAFQGLDDGTESSSYESVEPIGSEDLFCCESSDACINLKFTCDGVRNCDDGSDEGPSACALDYGVFGSLEILAVVLVALALVTAFLAFVAFVVCFCRSVCRDDKRLVESTEFIYQDTGASAVQRSQPPVAPPPQPSAEYHTERTDYVQQGSGISLPPSSFAGGIPRAAVNPNEPFDIHMFDTAETLASIGSSTQLLRRQASLEDRNRNVVYNPNAAALDDEAARSMLLSNFTWAMPRPQIRESSQHHETMVRSHSMESIVSYGQWENFWLRRRPDNVEIVSPERNPLGLDPYEVISESEHSTLYVNEPRSSAEQAMGRVMQRSFRNSHRRSRSLSPAGREATPRDLLSPDEEWHVGRTPADYEQLTNINRTRDVPRFYLSGPTPNIPGSEV